MFEFELLREWLEYNIVLCVNNQYFYYVLFGTSVTNNKYMRLRIIIWVNQTKNTTKKYW